MNTSISIQKVKKLISIYQTFMRLGPPNVFLWLVYKISLKLPYSKAKRIESEFIDSILFSTISPKSDAIKCTNRIPRTFKYFGWYTKINDFEIAPAWFQNFCTGATIKDPMKDWWDIPDFDDQIGDIKTIWEQSRFNWAPHLSQLSFQDDAKYLDILNSWIRDWQIKNPPYKGPNWKCGQEASIRLINLATASFILGQTKTPTISLLRWVETHLKRIDATTHYAVSQQNNHAISEAAALFIGGTWISLTSQSRFAANWASKGREHLEKMTKTLIELDGTFSQYSVNYQRLVLVTLSFCEVWRRHWRLDKFTDAYYEKIQKATRWLFEFTQYQTGSAPNIGSNDGTNILNLSHAKYTDMRPVIQLATALFFNKRAYELEGADYLSNWLNVKVPIERLDEPKSTCYSSGGFITLRHENKFLLMRTPKPKFRPHQSDALHLDFWIDGHNIFGDAGTYSYVSTYEISQYFTGSKGHNTIEFDNRSQMPQIKRFLYTNWTNTSQSILKNQKQPATAKATYTDYRSASHTRTVALHDSKMLIEDVVKGFKNQAVLRWRLNTENIVIQNNTVISDKISMLFSSNVPIKRLEITDGWESMHYLKKRKMHLIELEINKPGIISTEVCFNT